MRISGHAMGRGKVRHREFGMASGEMSSDAFGTFLKRSSIGDAPQPRWLDPLRLHGLAAPAGASGRRLPYLFDLEKPAGLDKSNASQGTFYRSKHELIGVFKSGSGPHINNFELGGQGRYRSNVMDCPGVNSFHPARTGDLMLHPTVKPAALIADLIRDCSRRNGVILDPFGGSGTTLLAAERTGRVRAGHRA